MNILTRVPCSQLYFFGTGSNLQNVQCTDLNLGFKKRANLCDDVLLLFQVLKSLVYYPVWNVPPPWLISFLVNFFSLHLPPALPTHSLPPCVSPTLEDVPGAGLLTLALVTLEAGGIILVGPPVCCQTLGGLLGFGSLIPVASPSPAATTKRYLQICPNVLWKGQNCPRSSNHRAQHLCCEFFPVCSKSLGSLMLRRADRIPPPETTNQPPGETDDCARTLELLTYLSPGKGF